MNLEAFSMSKLAEQIQACASEQFTGRLDLTVEQAQSQQWSLYFRQGGLIWCTSSLHPMRRWYRHLSRHCPQLILDREQSAVAKDSSQSQCWDYESLDKLVKQRKIQWQQMEEIVEANILEILFDIIQWGEGLRYHTGGQLNCKPIHQNTIESKLVTISANQAWRYAMKLWDAWQRAGLAEVSPNQAPVILQAEQLQRQTSQLVYQNLSTLANGNQTFRDLAVKLNRSLLLLTQPVTPFIRKGLMGLKDVADLSYAIKPVTAPNPTQEDQSKPVETRSLTAQSPAQLTCKLPPQKPSTPQPTSPLIVCIDDSRSDGQTMSKILTEAGYRCITIQDPVDALPTLLENKPDLIFLDLIMPIANGYEICSQIRRMSLFKDTPIIILTSNDGIVDRVRAKMVGSSGFLAKPIDQEKVLTTLQKHVQVPTPVPTQRYQTDRALFVEPQVLKVE